MLDKSKLLKAIHSTQTARYKQIQLATTTLHSHLQQLQHQYTSLSSQLQSLSLQRQQLTSMYDDLNSSRPEQEALLRERFDKEKKRYEALLYDLELRRKEFDNDKDKTLHALLREKKAADEYRARIEQLDAARTRAEREKAIKRSQVELLRNEPAKLELNLRMLDKLEKDVEADDLKAARLVDDGEARVLAVLKERKAVSLQLDEVSLGIEGYRLNIAKRKANMDEMAGERELEKSKVAKVLDALQACGDERMAVKAEVTRVQSDTAEYTKQVEALKKAYEKVRRKKETITSVVRPLQLQIAAKEAEVARLTAAAASVQQQTAGLQTSNEALVLQLLDTEDRDAAYDAQLQAVNADIADAEAAIAAVEAKGGEVDAAIKALEVERGGLIHSLGRVQREAHRLREAQGLAVMAAKEAQKGVEELVRTIRLCGDKYEVLKGQKGQLTQLVGEMEAALADVVERAKMLDAEMVVLTGEMVEKERNHREMGAQVSELKARTDKLRGEENRLRVRLREEGEREVELQLEVGQLSDVMRGLEQGMEGMKGQYVQAVTARNGVGLALIDRNDELCLLYEQLEVMARMLKAYEEDIRAEDEAAVLVVRDTEDVKRRVDVARRQIPSGKAWEERLRHRDHLTRLLAEERREVERLSTLLETPPPLGEGGEEGGDGGGRARMLGGEDPDAAVLAGQVEALEERIGRERVRLLEVELQLKETENVVGRLGREVAEVREGQVRAAVEAVDDRAEARRMERAMQADVSELAMYQAMVVKAQVERQRAAEEVAEMRRRVEAGQAPSKEAEAEWVRRQRERVRLREALTAVRRSREEEEAMETMVRSTAEVRPNAYIQPGLGLPKPYGGLAPFKPSVLGAQMRHFRIPVQKEVQL